MAMNEVNIRWTMPNGVDTSSVMYFSATTPIATQRLRLGGLASGVAVFLNDQTEYSVATSGRVLEEETGALLGEWTHTSIYDGVGGDAGEPVADSTQVLLRWVTGSVLGGRFVRGRTFIPGLSVSHLTNGNLSTTAISGCQAAQSSFLGAGTGFGVWHRPKGGVGGALVPASGGTTWQELAVLRRRRNS